MGSGESDYNGFILKRGHEREALVALLQALKKPGWDILRLGDIHRDSPTERFLSECSRLVGFRLDKREHTACPYIGLPATAEAYLSTLKTHLKQNIRARTRKLNELGNVRFAVAPGDVSIAEAMSSFFLLHENRWGALGQEGTLAGERLKSMHAEAAQRLGRYLHTGFLEVDGKRIACQYGYTFNGVRYSYLRGWDPEYKKLGVANILLLHLIEEAINAGVKEYDFLRGAEEYKFEFTNTARLSTQYWLSRSKLKLFLMLAYERY